MVKEENDMRRSLSERIFSVFNTVFLIILSLMTLYPFLYIVFASFSDPVKIISNQGILLWTEGFSLSAYKQVFENRSIYIGYGNTLFYVIVGTAVNIYATASAAYVLSRQNLMLKKFFTLMFIFTMYISGGLIPSYLLMNKLGLVNNRLGLILPVAVSTYNLLIMITAFKNIPASLEESAKIDGASDWKILSRIIIPLAKPTIMVIMLYYAVGHWNAWFRAMIYIRDSYKMPLQLFLRDILTRSQLGAMAGDSIEDVGATIKYAVILVSTVPILCLYPLIQKHFVQGIMIGAVKE
jgi:putative aldouronate transport system permease protein